MFKSLVAACLLLVAVSAGAQIIPQFDHVLLPVMNRGQIPGGFGSLWQSTLVARNNGATPLVVQASLGFCAGLCADFHVKAQTVFTPDTLPIDGYPGVYLFIEKGHVDDFSFNLRVQDASRQALTWGTEIPVIRERDTLTGTVQLLNVPLDSRFRQTFRVYDFDGREGKQVRVRIYPMDSNVLAAETVLALTAPPGMGNITQAVGYASIGQFTDAFPQLAGLDRVRVEVTPLTEGLRFWTFVSITNNETQHVTTITP